METVKKNEVWLGNMKTESGIPSHYKHLKTIRFGKQAYDIHGKKLNPDYVLPLIINKSEEDEYNKIYMGRMRQISMGRIIYN